MPEREAILLMAYGTPDGLDDVAAYYTHIRHGRKPSREQLDALEARYRAIGGGSPLKKITMQQAAGLEERTKIPVIVGFKHSAPSIDDAVARLRDEEIDRGIGLVMAPHYSSMSIADYARRAEKAAAEIGWAGELKMVESWHLEPGYIYLLASRILQAMDTLPDGDRAKALVVFTAHSLPAAILKQGDPYPAQLEQTAAAVARQASIAHWRVGWQSAGRTDDEWLSPDLIQILDEAFAQSYRAVVVCPCGFVADHLEVLYDIDIEAAQRAEQLGLSFARTRSPNSDPEFLDVLASVARRALRPAA